jgi:hypothetical protein
VIILITLSTLAFSALPPSSTPLARTASDRTGQTVSPSPLHPDEVTDVRPTLHIAAGMTVRDGDPLIGLLLRENGHEVTRYFTSEAAADAATTPDDDRAALAVIGAFNDLDVDDMMDDLARMRHERKPTPPIGDAR